MEVRPSNNKLTGDVVLTVTGDEGGVPIRGQPQALNYRSNV